MLIVWLTLHHIDLCISLGCFKIFFHMTSVATQQGEWVCFQKTCIYHKQQKNSFTARKHLVLGQVFLVRKTKFPSYNHSISILKYLNKFVIYITLLSYDLSISMSSLLTASICVLLPHAQCRVIASLSGWGLAEGSHAG